MKRPVLVAIAALAALIAACGSDGDGSSAANFNDADVAFAQLMIPHHEQAIEMTRLAETRAQSPEVKDLAMRIEDAQGPEIEQMRAWLEEWGEPVEDEGGGDMGGMDHGGDDMADMEGGMSEGEMAGLEEASGAEFDRMFLEMMVEHHQGAVTMAETELEQGENPEAKELAQRIIDTQRAEIEEMQGLLEGV